MKPSSPADLSPLPRCCAHHGDWQTLADHLVRDFPDVSAGDVLRELARAKSAVDSFGLVDGEQLGVAELMTRHQLLLLTGDVPDAARLDPERHERGVAAT